MKILKTTYIEITNEREFVSLLKNVIVSVSIYESLDSIANLDFVE